MIFDDIDKKIKEMKNLRRLETLQNNFRQQEAIDEKYQRLVAQVQIFSRTLKYAEGNLGLVLSESLQTDFYDLLVCLKKIVDSGYADKEGTFNAENNFKAIQNSMKKEWHKHYYAYTTSILNTVGVIQGIAPDRARVIVSNIKNAENWSADMDINILAKLKDAMSCADELIKSLNMNQAIIGFLTKMTAGKATLIDLNDEVLTWLKHESLESKVRLSFVPQAL